MTIETEGVIVAIVIGSTIVSCLVLGFLFYILRLWIRGPMKGNDCKRRLDGRKVVITGASSGLGRVMTKEMYRRGAEVIMLCRDVKKAEKVADKIEKECRYMELCDRGYIKIVHCDLSIISSVKQCVQQLLECYTQIDILVNNAGIKNCPELKSEDGYDLQFQTNYLGHFQLTTGITPLMTTSALNGFQPRIIIITDKVHHQGEIHWDDVNFKMVSKTLPYEPEVAYAQSKLANTMYANYLTDRLQGTGISVFGADPGPTRTQIYRFMYMKWYGCLLYPLFACFTKRPIEGVQSILFCALDESLDEITGGYYRDCKPIAPSSKSLNVKDCQRLWELSEKLLGLRSSTTEVL